MNITWFMWHTFMLEERRCFSNQEDFFCYAQWVGYNSKVYLPMSPNVTYLDEELEDKDDDDY